ncbi:hypothetical protein DPMN_075395 [Dreissena polymorpha]|uniref:Uncharacterized protein n=1 Tax=Dreissena polymorpha TaxID=45954 RepID=A0A9D3YKE3_DREPO|nr:hypothetical protein DPMN_075395 [Dreissena polymorpha]
MGFVPISYNSSRSPLSQRYPELSSRLYAVGTSVPSFSSALPLSVLEMVSGQSVYKDFNLSSTRTPSSVVTRRGQSLGRSTPSSSATFFIPNYGCEQGRVRCSSGTTQSDNFRVVVSSGVTATYQQCRNASSFLAVSHFQSRLGDSCVMVSTDNTSVVTYIQTQGRTHSHFLYLETKELLLLCKTLDISLLENIFQVASTPRRMGCLANTSCYHQSGHFIKK